MIDYNILGAFSPYLISFFMGYLVTESIKILLITLKHREFRWREFFKSGGMPSSHSGNVTALAVTVGLLNGFNSAIFGIAAGFAAIVMYDAMHVRRAVGEQGEVIRKLIERDAKLEVEVSQMLSKKSADKLHKPYYARGHKPMEVLVGSIVGATVGVAVAWISVL